MGPSDDRITFGAHGAAGRHGLLRRLPWEFRLLFRAAIYLGLPVAIALASAFVYYTAAIPNPMVLRLKERAPVVRVLARDGQLLSERGSSEAYMPIDLLPQHLIDAVVATEDRRFFKHHGLDPAGLLRAALTNLRAGRFVQGGSTITQQLAKNLFLSSQRTLSRKLEEVVMALWLELRLDKRSILELYLNRVYFGGGAYGVETASRRFFDKSAKDLTLPECAVLAGLLKAPSKFSPASSPASARARAQSVLGKMVEARRLTAEQAEVAGAAELKFADPGQQRDQAGVDYVVDAALERLPGLIGSSVSEVVVETTIDLGLQRRAQGLVQAALSGEGRSLDASQAALVVLDLDGGMRALVGGRSYLESQFNRALRAKRQPGSAFKTFVYLAALERGLQPDSIVQDLPILGSGWSPRNEGSGYRGAVTLRDALALSLNAATVRLHMSGGARSTAAVAQRLGVRSELRADASLALGTSEVTLSELTAAYGVLANGGRSLEPHLVRRVRTGSGEVLYQRPAESGRTLVAPAQVAQINEMLGAVLTSGTGKRAALPRHPAAGKTGTSQDFRDAWFVGFTGQLVAGVWVGNDDRRPMRRVMGGSLPAKLWHDVMASAHEQRAPVALPGVRSPLLPAVSLAGRAETGEIAGGDNQPLLPRQQIETDFIERALAGERPPPSPTRPAAKSWIGTQMDGLLRGLGLDGSAAGG
jgi:penicillin-binding protein 1A